MKTNTNQNAFGQREYECKSTKMAALKKNNLIVQLFLMSQQFP